VVTGRLRFRSRYIWLAACASGSNQPAILAAPVTVIVGYDLDFAEKLPELFPARGEALKAMFVDEHLTYTTAFRNSSLQGAYLVLAARALGLDCQPILLQAPRGMLLDRRRHSWSPIAVGCESTG
jgi:nitroreductase